MAGSTARTLDKRLDRDSRSRRTTSSARYSGVSRAGVRRWAGPSTRVTIHQNERPSPRPPPRPCPCTGATGGRRRGRMRPSARAGTGPRRNPPAGRHAGPAATLEVSRRRGGARPLRARRWPVTVSVAPCAVLRASRPGGQRGARSALLDPYRGERRDPISASMPGTAGRVRAGWTVRHGGGQDPDGQRTPTGDSHGDVVRARHRTRGSPARPLPSPVPIRTGSARSRQGPQVRFTRGPHRAGVSRPANGRRPIRPARRGGLEDHDRTGHQRVPCRRRSATGGRDGSVQASGADVRPLSRRKRPARRTGSIENPSAGSRGTAQRTPTTDLLGVACRPVAASLRMPSCLNPTRSSNRCQWFF
jgi:hypothetical protein